MLEEAVERVLCTSHCQSHEFRSCFFCLDVMIDVFLESLRVQALSEKVFCLPKTTLKELRRRCLDQKLDAGVSLLKRILPSMISESFAAATETARRS